MGVSKVCSAGKQGRCQRVRRPGILPGRSRHRGDRPLPRILLRRAALPRDVPAERKTDCRAQGGRSRQGAEAALSHTASLAGNQRIITGALAQAGVIEARDFKQMMDLCRSLALMKPPAGGSGPGGRSDLERRGGDRRHRFRRRAGACHGRPLRIDASSRWRSSFPTWMPVANPVDLWPAVERQTGDDLDVVRPLARGPPRRSGGGRRLSPCLHQQSPEPARTSPICPPRSGAPANRSSPGSSAGGTMPMRFRRRPWSHGIPVFPEISRAAECLAAVLRGRRRPEPVIAGKAASRPLPADLQHLLDSASGPLDEQLSKSILAGLRHSDRSGSRSPPMPSRPRRRPPPSVTRSS